MEHIRYIIKRDNLIDFCIQACEHEGFSKEASTITAEVLSDTDMLGTYSHGTKNLNNYLKKAAAGGINKEGKGRIIKEGSAWALLDGEGGMGMVVSHHAMELAIDKAVECGIAIVSVRNSTHFGAAGYYSCMAAKRGLFGFAMSNTEPNMCVPGGKSREIGNSPISYAFPQKDGQPVFLDIALSAVAALKIEKAWKQGETIPDTWAVDKNGFPTTNPADFIDGGASQPMAGHKGYGLSMMVEILTGLLAGGKILHEMTSWIWDLPAFNQVSHSFLAIDLSKFMEPDDFDSRMGEYTDSIKNSPKRDGISEIFLPGEIENRNYKNHMNNGLELPDDVAESLIELSGRIGIKIHWMQGGIR